MSFRISQERKIEMEEVEIIKIEEIKDVEYVYDPCCDDPYNYISNGIVSHNCILWIDEIEKGISGGASSGRSDGGTTSRVLSTFLTWMQEKTSPVFVVATANDHLSIPPEFLRAGRFDEIFFIDLPNKDEREEISKVLLRLRGLKHSEFNLGQLAGNSEDYSGAEIEKGIDNAMLAGFLDNKRKINTDDIVEALGSFKSLFEMKGSDFEELREWADGCCIKANADFQETVSYGLDSNKKLDFKE